MEETDMPTDTLQEFYRRYIDAANARQFDVIATLIHDDVMINGLPHKREDSLSGLREITDAVPDFFWHIEDLLTQDDRIAARLRDTGKPTKRWLGFNPTGASVEFTEFASYKVRDGRFAEMWFLMDVSAIADQLGS